MMDPFGSHPHQPMESVLSLQTLGDQGASAIASTAGCTNTGICGDTWGCGSTGWCGVTNTCGSTTICDSQQKKLTSNAS